MKKILILFLSLVPFVSFCSSSHTDGEEFTVALVCLNEGSLYNIRLEVPPIPQAIPQRKGYLEERSDRWVIWVYDVDHPKRWAKEFKSKDIEPLEVYTTWQPWFWNYVEISKKDVRNIVIVDK